MRNLLKSNVVFTWHPVHEKEFNELKIILSSQLLIQFYNPMLPTKISCNTSKTQLCTILEQQHGDQWLPVLYASRVIAETQGRYALVIQFGCEHFHQYIYGIPVQLETNHKPLVAIFKKVLNDYPAQLQLDSRCKNMISISASRKIYACSRCIVTSGNDRKNGKD